MKGQGFLITGENPVCLLKLCGFDSVSNPDESYDETWHVSGC